MVTVLVRLKLALLANAFRRSAWQVVGICLAIFYGLSLAAAQLASIPLLARQDPEFIESAWVIAGTMVVLGWMMVPIISMGADMTLDPRRFAIYGVTARSLMPGLGIATLVGVPGVVTVVLSLANSQIWRQYGIGVVVWAAVCAAFAVLLCVVGSRVSTIWAGRLLGSRWAKVLIGAAVVLPVAAAIGLIARRGTSGRLEIDATILPQIADWLAWTPLGAPWGVTASIARGQYGAATYQGLLTLVTLVLLVLAWWWGLRATMEQPQQTRLSSGRLTLGVFERARSDLAAVVARCTTYWLRDARYAAGLAMVPIIPLFFYLTTGGRGAGMLALGPCLVFLITWSISADVAYDGSAFWLHLATGVRGWVDRVGRVAAALMFAFPLGMAGAFGSLWATGRWDATAATVGLTLGVMFISVGLASVLSAVFVYPVPAAGENPFSAPSGSSAVNLMTQLVGWAALMLCSAPIVVTGYLAINRASGALGWLTLVAGVVFGGLFLALGVLLGGRLIDRGGPDLYARTVAVR
ncbi:ABC-2 type transport system permease protein [Micrococcales bacterium KH10]|nr:ABC-2 type transport system permease protein [Micrococcales bacterium KH10]